MPAACAGMIPTATPHRSPRAACPGEPWQPQPLNKHQLGFSGSTVNACAGVASPNRRRGSRPPAASASHPRRTPAASARTPRARAAAASSPGRPGHRSASTSRRRSASFPRSAAPRRRSDRTRTPRCRCDTHVPSPQLTLAHASGSTRRPRGSRPAASPARRYRLLGVVVGELHRDPAFAARARRAVRRQHALAVRAAIRRGARLRCVDRSAASADRSRTADSARGSPGCSTGARLPVQSCSDRPRTPDRTTSPRATCASSRASGTDTSGELTDQLRALVEAVDLPQSVRRSRCPGTRTGRRSRCRTRRSRAAAAGSCSSGRRAAAILDDERVAAGLVDRARHHLRIVEAAERVRREARTRSISTTG